MGSHKWESERELTEEVEIKVIEGSADVVREKEVKRGVRDEVEPYCCWRELSKGGIMGE